MKNIVWVTFMIFISIKLVGKDCSFIDKDSNLVFVALKTKMKGVIYFGQSKKDSTKIFALFQNGNDSVEIKQLINEKKTLYFHPFIFHQIIQGVGKKVPADIHLDSEDSFDSKHRIIGPPIDCNKFELTKIDFEGKVVIYFVHSSVLKDMFGSKLMLSLNNNCYYMCISPIR